MSDGPGRGDGSEQPPPGGSFPPPPGGSSDYPGGGGFGAGGEQPQQGGWGGQGSQQGGWGSQGGGQPSGWGGGEPDPAWGDQSRQGTGWDSATTQPGWGGQPGYGAPPQRNTAALASMICGLVSLGCLFLFFFLITIPIAIATGLAAVIAGFFGLRAAGRLRNGRGQAITGLVTGTISLLLIGLVTFAAVFTWSQLGFESNPFSDPEGFLREMEERGVEVDEQGRVDVDELQRQLEDDGQF